MSSAHVIEAVRLADTLAALRERPLAGLSEVTEATRAVMCGGNDVLLDLVTREAVVGELLGDRTGRYSAGAGGGGPRGAGSAVAAEAGRRPSVWWTWICARRTIWRSRGCCTGCGFSGSTGVCRPPTTGGTRARSGRCGRWPGIRGSRWIWLPRARMGRRCSGAATTSMLKAAEESSTLAEVTSALERSLLADLGRCVADVAAGRRHPGREGCGCRASDGGAARTRAVRAVRRRPGSLRLKGSVWSPGGWFRGCVPGSGGRCTVSIRTRPPRCWS